jgi:hypothetical protein
MNRRLYVIAREIELTWVNKDGVNIVSPYARPYLDAMHCLNSMNEMFIYDTADSVVRYFLSNANGWRGEDAKRIKAELKGMLK